MAKKLAVITTPIGFRNWCRKNGEKFNPQRLMTETAVCVDNPIKARGNVFSGAVTMEPLPDNYAEIRRQVDLRIR